MPEFQLTIIDQLVAIANHHQINLDRPTLEHQYLLGDVPLDEKRFKRIAQETGLEIKSANLSWAKLAKLGEAFPLILILENGESLMLSGFESKADNDFADAVYSVEKDEDSGQFVHHPILKKDLLKLWRGKAYLFKSIVSKKAKQEKFNLFWFVKEASKQKTIFLEIILLALIIHATSLAIPIFFQITVDKVLVHESFSTLYVLTTAVVLVLVFEGVFNFLKDYLLAFATSKIDMRVATRTFGHLVRLPLSFFQRNTAGIITKHMHQTEEIREFLTGKVLETALDATALFVFLPLLFLYSPELAWIVLGFSCLIALVIAVMIKPFQNALLKLYEVEGERQSLLVEGIHGISTIKSLALEPRKRKIWDDASAKSVRSNFKVDKLAAIAESMVATLENLMTVAILFFGAQMVFTGDLTVGKLVAFKMISGNVSKPLIKIVEMIHEYQKARLAVKMLGNIMNSPIEQNSESQALRPTINGDIRFENVKFSYDGTDKPALNDLNFEINHGEVIGIVGRSGSGKSTLARVIQGLYPINAGQVVLNNCDIREISLDHLRQNIGIVLQENFLFRGTVRDNIALTVPHAKMEDIKEACTMAGADEFVSSLKHGYDTELEENATNLSGGQKQRLAIARALLRKPELLIFDEATSALDVESETIIQNNLAEIANGRTMLIIAHRLSTLRDADRIMVLDQGRIESFASHDDLMGATNGSKIYQHMWDQQIKNARGENGTN